jgi:5'-phosphate synthase pdxT subunit
LRVGVLAVQGAVSEHLDALRRAAGATGREIEAVAVRTAADLAGCAGIILPGGESTAISRLVRSAGIEGELRERGGKDLAVFGTCAGMILISATASHDVENKDIHLLGLLDADVDRNAFGRQRDSFEAILDVAGVGTVPAVFIRAPALNRVWGGTTVLAEHRGRIVAAQHGRVLATAFHPELTADTRLHERFLALCEAG